MLREISNLVRDIVIIIVAATFIELLLPRKEFHRYIRMVVGLLIILVLLSAVSQFMGVGPDAGMFLRQLEGHGIPEAPALQDGLFTDRVLGEYRARIALEAERIARDFLQGEAAARAEVFLREDEDFNAEVKTIRLYLSEAGGDGGGGVEPVLIEVGPLDADAGEPSPSPEAESRPLREFVARHFNLEAGQVEVIYLDR